jgi:hypothetical protein
MMYQYYVFYGPTQCSFCGVISNNQRRGNGCHACLRGVMKIKALSR